jgi:glutamate-ammonia-ligase adenylyltransferase
MQSSLVVLRQSGLGTGAALRVLRQLVMERTPVVLDCEQRAELKVVAEAALTELAEARRLTRRCSNRKPARTQHGAPLAPTVRVHRCG